MLEKHGHSMYKNAGCRCDKCKAGAAEYMRAYRQKNRSWINYLRRERYAAKKLAALNIPPSEETE